MMSIHGTTTTCVETHTTSVKHTLRPRAGPNTLQARRQHQTQGFPPSKVRCRCSQSREHAGRSGLLSVRLTEHFKLQASSHGALLLLPPTPRARSAPAGHPGSKDEIGCLGRARHKHKQPNTHKRHTKETHTHNTHTHMHAAPPSQPACSDTERACSHTGGTRLR